MTEKKYIYVAFKESFLPEDHPSTFGKASSNILEVLKEIKAAIGPDYPSYKQVVFYDDRVIPGDDLEKAPPGSFIEFRPPKPKDAYSWNPQDRWQIHRVEFV